MVENTGGRLDDVADASVAPPERNTLLLLGKLPPPYMGPSIATQTLLQSRLTEYYRVVHVDTNVHESLETLGGWSVRKVFANLQIFGKMVRALSRDSPDVVLIPISQATVGFLKDSVFILLSRLFRKPTMLHLRGSNFQNWLQTSSLLVRRYVEFVVASAQGVIVLGNNLRHLFAAYFSEGRIFVVPNGADFALAESDVAHRKVDGVVRLLYVGNLQPSKGIADVIDAVANLKPLETRFRLAVVGQWRDDETRKDCTKQVAEYDLPVDFVGPAYGADKIRWLQESDVFVFTPREPEGHPWVIVEAMANGLPIVSTDKGAITESVRDGVNGYIVKDSVPTQIARRLSELIEDADLRRKMGNASRQSYLEQFTEDHMVSRLIRALDTLVGGDQNSL